MKNRLAAIAGLIGIGALISFTPSLADGPAPHGYLLSVWSGILDQQTHAITAFEGEDAYKQCDAAARAMREYDSRFANVKDTTCIPF